MKIDPVTTIVLRKRPFLIRLRNHYVAYRSLGLSRYESLRGAWMLARI